MVIKRVIRLLTKEMVRNRAKEWWQGGEMKVSIVDGSITYIAYAPQKVIDQGYAQCDVCNTNILAGDGFVLDSMWYREMVASQLYANLPEPIMNARIDSIIQGTFIAENPELLAKVKLAQIALGSMVPNIRAEQIQTRGWAMPPFIVCRKCISLLIKS